MSLLAILAEYKIENTDENVKILQTILSKWPDVVELKSEADFWVKNVAIWDIPNEQRNRESETLIMADTDLDGCSLYSGDTNSEHDVVKDLICQLFHDKDSADTRYTRHEEDNLFEPSHPDK